MNSVNISGRVGSGIDLRYTPLEILATAGLSKDRGAPLIGRLLEASTIEKV